MKSILISIKPEWVCKILNGEKTIEIRKTAPKCELPVKVYIYCTKDGYLHLENEGYWSYSRNQKYTYKRHGKVVAKFTLKKVEEIKPFSFMKLLGAGLTEKLNEIADKACFGWLGISKYANGKSVYLWYIEDLEIFDEPKELSEFYGMPKKINGLYGAEMVNISLSKAPESWCYVEEDE